MRGRDQSEWTEPRVGSLAERLMTMSPAVILSNDRLSLRPDLLLEFTPPVS